MAAKVAKKLVSIAKGTERTASDGRKYRWIGSQWGRVTRNNKVDLMGRRAIQAELTASVMSSKKVSKAKQQKKSVAWFKRKVGESAKGFKKKAKLEPGKIFTFGYDAKYKAILPYWDKFPLIVVLDAYKDGFLGLNFHYVSPMDRMVFFKKLMKFANQKGEVESMTSSAKFNVSWDAVKNVRHADKMIHKYLYGHVRTSLLEAPPNEWENVIFLPYQKFVGASHKSVWSK
jgi:hypothetical protein|tara:strand:- start:1570 stop:2259 length:690 start_codon:yes stop_codon:yes gene_type:complete